MKKLITFLIILPSLVLTFSFQTIQAISESDFNAIYGNHVYYEPGVQSGCSSLSAGGVDGFLRALAQQESGGNITAENTESTASGKYQYLNSTWRSRYAIYGPASDYSRAKDAPEEVQDAVAYIEYAKKFQDYDNDLFKLALSHFYPVAITDESKLDIIPEGNVITPREYAEGVIEKINNGVGSDIPLLYRDAPEFSEWLEKAGIDTSKIGSSNLGCATGELESVAEIAKQYVGRQEENASNCGDEINLFFESMGEECGFPWCALFVRFVFDEAGLTLGTTTNSSLALGEWFEENKFFFTVDEPYMPQVGDVFVRERGVEGSNQGHTGIVVEVNGYSITTVEGNISNQVMERTYSDYRTMHRIVGYGRLVDADTVDPIAGYDPLENLPSGSSGNTNLSEQ